MTETLNIPEVVPMQDRAGTAQSSTRTSTSIGPIAVLMIALINAWLGMAAYHFWVLPTVLPRVAVVDIATLYREREEAFTRMVSGDQVTDLDRARALDMAERFARELPLALAQLSEDCACTIHPANAVAGRHGVEDLTDLLRRRLSQ